MLSGPFRPLDNNKEKYAAFLSTLLVLSEVEVPVLSEVEVLVLCANTKNQTTRAEFYSGIQTLSHQMQ